LVGIDNDDESIAALPKGPKKQRCDENVEFTKEARPLPLKTTPGAPSINEHFSNLTADPRIKFALIAL
jgi:hypothetical protein